MPGQNTFIAGFTQCMSKHGIPCAAADTLYSERWGHQPEHVCCFLDTTLDHESDVYGLYSDGAFCESPGQPWDGQPCEFEHSTCGNTTQDCHGRYVLHWYSSIYVNNCSSQWSSLPNL